MPLGLCPNCLSGFPDFAEEAQPEGSDVQMVQTGQTFWFNVICYMFYVSLVPSKEGGGPVNKP